MTLQLDDVAQIMAAIRKVPETAQDAAWKYVADRLRPVRQPTVFDIKDATDDMLARYRGRE